MRTIWSALLVSIAVNVVGYGLIFATDARFPRYGMSPGFALGWHAPVSQALKFVILFGVNIVVWAAAAVPLVLAMNAILVRWDRLWESGD